MRIQRIIKISIDKERCKACEYCISVCPKQIIKLSNELNSRGYHYAFCEDSHKCHGCKLCAIMCPEIAIEIESID